MGILSKLVVPKWMQVASAFIKRVPREVWYALAIALALLWLRAHWINDGEANCEQRHAKAVERANQKQAKREAKRDSTAAAIADKSHTKAATATRKTEEATHARAQQIEAAPATGACRAPDGLPDLAPAVDAANAARRAAVQGRPYTRRQLRSMAGAGRSDHRRVGEEDPVVVERHPRDPDAGTPAPAG